MHRKFKGSENFKLIQGHRLIWVDTFQIHLLSPIIEEPVSYILIINIGNEIPSYNKIEKVTAVIKRKISQTQTLYVEPTYKTLDYAQPSYSSNLVLSMR